MYFPINTPNIPQSEVTVVAVSDAADEALFHKLSELNIKVVKTLRSDHINVIDFHTDLFLMNLSAGTLFIDESQEKCFVKYLTIGYELKKISGIKSPYPSDCGLNCVVMGDKLICNINTTHPDVLSSATDKRYKLVTVNQGYAKCSVCVVNSNALITDDESIYRSCQINQIDSVLIKKGSIRLDGFDYGFIGGCTGLIDKNKLLFNGDINYHKDCNKIIDFLNKHKVEPVVIENQPLTDIGSVIPLCERNNS